MPNGLWQFRRYENGQQVGEPFIVNLDRPMTDEWYLAAANPGLHYLHPGDGCFCTIVAVAPFHKFLTFPQTRLAVRAICNYGPARKTTFSTRIWSVGGKRGYLVHPHNSAANYNKEQYQGTAAEGNLKHITTRKHKIISMDFVKGHAGSLDGWVARCKCGWVAKWASLSPLSKEVCQTEATEHINYMRNVKGEK